MKRITRIQSELQDEIDQAAERFGDHEGMSEARVLRWLEQFPDEDLSIAVRVMEATRYYTGLNVRSMTKQLHQIATGELRTQRYRRTAFVAVGDPGSGSGVVARVLRDLIRGTPSKMLSMLDLSRLEPGKLDAIVFIDDFSGTGQTLEKWWQNVEPLVRPVGAVVFLGLLVLNGLARERIESFANVLAVEELDSSQNVLSEESTTFSTSEKLVLLAHCQKTGCEGQYERGFGTCGLLLSFKHGCPNNSLPILWYSGRGKKKWRPLFNRRAI